MLWSWVQTPQGNGLETQARFLCCRSAISFLFRKLQSWLFRTSSDWMRPLHFRKGNLPYSKSTDLNVTHILKIPSQQHQTSVWPNNWEASAALTQKTNPDSWNPSLVSPPLLFLGRGEFGNVETLLMTDRLSPALASSVPETGCCIYSQRDSAFIQREGHKAQTPPSWYTPHTMKLASPRGLLEGNFAR